MSPFNTLAALRNSQHVHNAVEEKYSPIRSCQWFLLQLTLSISRQSTLSWFTKVPLTVVKNSRYNTDLKAVNYTQFLGFGKDYTLKVDVHVMQGF
jgi:hypothetical protein